MKKFITIACILCSMCAHAQNIRMTQIRDWPDTAANLLHKSDSGLYVTIPYYYANLIGFDTTGRWISDMRRLPGSTTVQKFKNGVWSTAYIDSVGIPVSTYVRDSLAYAVISISNAPPVSPVVGYRYLVGSAGTGTFAGHNNQLALYTGTGSPPYLFTAPVQGKMIINQGDQAAYVYTGTGWATAKLPFLNGLNFYPDELKLGNIYDFGLGFYTNNLQRGRFSDSGVFSLYNVPDYEPGDSVLYKHNGEIRAGAPIIGGDTLFFGYTLDSTLLEQWHIPFPANDKRLHIDQSLLWDSVLNRLLIGYTNISALDNTINLGVNGSIYSRGLKLDFPVAHNNGYLTEDPTTKIVYWKSFDTLRVVECSCTSHISNDTLYVNTSGGGGSQDLQSVTDINPLTTNPLIVWNGAQPLVGIANVAGAGTLSFGDASGNAVNITANLPTGTNALHFPNANNKTFVTSVRVNGTTYDGDDNGLADLGTISSGGGTVTGGVINWPGTIYSTPTTGSVGSGTLTFAPSLASQSAYTVFGNHTSGSAAPTFGKLPIQSVSATGTPSSTTYLRGDGTWSTPASGGNAAGSYGWAQLNRNGVFDATDSLTFISGTFNNKGATHLNNANGTPGVDSPLVQSGGIVKKISPTYYTDVIAGASTQVAYFNTASQLTSSANMAYASNSLNLLNNSIVSTITNGLSLHNNTAATSSVFPQSPAIELGAYGWNTNATNLGSQPLNFRIYVQPVSGNTGVPKAFGNLVISAEGNSGVSASTVMTLTQGGAVTFPGNVTGNFVIGTSQVQSVNVSGSTQLTAGGTGTTTYKLTDAGSAVTPSLFVASGSPNYNVFFSKADGLTLGVRNSNGSTATWIPTAGFQINGVSNTQGAETSDLSIYTKPTSLAIQERMRIMGANGDVLIGTTTDVTSSKLTVESTTQGILPPRMTTTQKNAIASPAEGLMVYDLTLHKLYVYDGTTWQACW